MLFSGASNSKAEHPCPAREPLCCRIKIVSGGVDTRLYSYSNETTKSTTISTVNTLESIKMLRSTKPGLER